MEETKMKLNYAEIKESIQEHMIENIEMCVNSGHEFDEIDFVESELEFFNWLGCNGEW